VADPSLVGVVIDRVRFPVEVGKIREFAIALGDEDPVWHDQAAARAAGHPNIPAPPTFVVVAGHWRDQQAMVDRLGLDLRRIVVGGCEWVHHRPVYAGDELVGERVVVEVRERVGARGGRMTFLTLKTTFTNQRGETTVEQLDTIIELGEPDG
jgi:acyl dehydratase